MLINLLSDPTIGLKTYWNVLRLDLPGPLHWSVLSLSDLACKATNEAPSGPETTRGRVDLMQKTIVSSDYHPSHY